MNENLNRRRFIQVTAGVATGLTATAGNTRGVAIVVDPVDRVASSPAARWAATELKRALTEREVSARIVENAAQAAPTDLRIMSAGIASPGAAAALGDAGVRMEVAPEALALCQRGETIWACGHDARGLTYALLELADRARQAADPVAALAVPEPVIERPANTARSITRLFTSDVEDKPWYNDREMWPAYLSRLAAQRFNRFSLAFGIGYDFLTAVTDAYFVFTYPFLLSVPGYKVRVPQLPDAERDRNLEMLRFISEQTVARGMDFQLALWMHGYRWIDSPNANYTIEGLTPETHAPYCRDAVRALLQAVPKISGVTFRIHGESGVAEGNYQFWKTIFDGVATCGRKVEIDMHAKGMDQGMIDAALGSGQPVKISPKFWAEHLGMPYHQADIRATEHPRPVSQATGLMKDLMQVSTGSRNFMRYGYGDLLRDDRKWGVLHRIWPGTQRLLIWGDPGAASAYSRAFSFCGSDGVEIMEPLSFKGRRGSGIAGGRCAYADKALNPRWDWQKYAYTYRVWGRLLYNPETDPDVWRRVMRHDFGPAAADFETALANSSRILSTVTTAHLPSAANNHYWPELYLNHSLVDAERPGPYTDTPKPPVFGTVSPLDPQLFYRIDDFADDLLKGERSGKYTPVDVATWIEDYAVAAASSLARGESRVTGKDRPEYRRLTIDIAVAGRLGHFFGAKFRAGVLYRIFDRTGDRGALEECLKAYRAAREAWAGIGARTKGVYMADITVGEMRQLRGHWADRLAEIDADMAAIAAKLDSAKPAQVNGPIARAVADALGRPRRLKVVGRHTPPAKFQPGSVLTLEFAAGKDYASVRLHYRHVNQGERWQSEAMQSDGRLWRATIPSEYTQSPYPLQYYFEMKEAPESAALYPGLGEQRFDQPYFVVRRV
ncbi:MAG: hypothetical protein EHM61_19805 [Acidobacteria bacterium]|nr:MAG: hypothetical protein EHM61_19805 [Acidobacteriota bacterium]